MSGKRQIVVLVPGSWDTGSVTNCWRFSAPSPLFSLLAQARYKVLCPLLLGSRLVSSLPLPCAIYASGTEADLS